MKIFSILTLTTSLILSQTGIEIARMVDTRKTPKDMSNVTKMVLTNSKGKSRVNKMASKSMEGNKKQIIWFLDPPDATRVISSIDLPLGPIAKNVKIITFSFVLPIKKIITFNYII